MWAGSSQDRWIEREQDNERILCADKKFDNYICLSYEDYESFCETYIEGCRFWKKDAKKYKKAFKRCGLWNNENFDMIKDCLDVN